MPKPVKSIKKFTTKAERIKLDPPHIAYGTVLTTPDKAWIVANSILRGEEQEVIIVLMLNAKNKLQGYVEIHRGGITQSIADVASILRPVIRHGSPAFIVAHNHPSWDPEPSVEDIRITHRLSAAAMILNIQMLDHLILGSEGYTSMTGKGYNNAGKFRRILLEAGESNE